MVEQARCEAVDPRGRALDMDCHAVLIVGDEAVDSAIVRPPRDGRTQPDTLYIALKPNVLADGGVLINGSYWIHGFC